MTAMLSDFIKKMILYGWKASQLVPSSRKNIKKVVLYGWKGNHEIAAGPVKYEKSFFAKQKENWYIFTVKWTTTWWWFILYALDEIKYQSPVVPLTWIKPRSQNMDDPYQLTQLYHHSLSPFLIPTLSISCHSPLTRSLPSLTLTHSHLPISLEPKLTFSLAILNLSLA